MEDVMYFRFRERRIVFWAVCHVGAVLKQVVKISIVFARLRAALF